MCLARKTPKDGKEENIRVRVTPEQKQRLVDYFGVYFFISVAKSTKLEHMFGA